MCVIILWFIKEKKTWIMTVCLYVRVQTLIIQKLHSTVVD